jgi:serine/threonine protein phosphatase 1
MNTFVIGDIHGCYFTLKKMLTNWNPSDQKLILIGDYIDRGNYSGRVLKLLWEIKHSYPEVLFLKGNHEYIYKFHYTNVEQTDWATIGAGKVTIADFVNNNISVTQAINFFDSLQLEYDCDGFKVSHAGIANSDTNVYEEDNYEYGILWTRKELLNIGKTQIIGHTPHNLKSPLYNLESNSYNIDSGCCYGRGLMGIIISEVGILLDSFYVEVENKDIV